MGKTEMTTSSSIGCLVLLALLLLVGVGVTHGKDVSCKDAFALFFSEDQTCSNPKSLRRSLLVDSTEEPRVEANDHSNSASYDNPPPGTPALVSFKDRGCCDAALWATDKGCVCSYREELSTSDAARLLSQLTIEADSDEVFDECEGVFGRELSQRVLDIADELLGDIDVFCPLEEDCIAEGESLGDFAGELACEAVEFECFTVEDSSLSKRIPKKLCEKKMRNKCIQEGIQFPRKNRGSENKVYAACADWTIKGTMSDSREGGTCTAEQALKAFTDEVRGVCVDT